MLLCLNNLLVKFEPLKVNKTKAIKNIPFLFAGFSSIYVNFVPISDFFLCCDRCLAVAFPTLYRRRARNAVAIVFLATIAVIFGGYFYFTKWFAYYNPNPTTTCGTYICLVQLLQYPRIMTYVKYVFCGLNFIAAFCLLFFMNFRKSSGTQAKFITQLNRSVLLITFVNIIFAFAPSFLLQIVMEVSLSNF